LAPVNLRYLKIYRNQRGKLVAYYRRGGISRRLLTEDGTPVEPGDLASLAAAWQQAHVAFEAAEVAATGAAENRTIKPRTLADLARHYRASDERAEKARATKADYEKGLGPLERNHGLLPVAGLRRHHVAQIRSRYAWREKVDKDGNTERVWNGRQANRIITVLSILLKLAVESLGWRSDNPALRPKRLKTGGVGYLPWKPEEFAQFRKRSDPDWQFAVLVALLTAQRGQDQVAMRWSDYDGSGIYVVQQKGNGRVRLWVPCHPALKAELDARRAHRQAELGEASIAALTILTRPDGRPWTANTFQKGASQAIRSAGLTGRVWHGLRGTAASWASEEGVNEKGIQALLAISQPRSRSVMPAARTSGVWRKRRSKRSCCRPARSDRYVKCLT
jgi:integrase